MNSSGCKAVKMAIKIESEICTRTILVILLCGLWGCSPQTKPSAVAWVTPVCPTSETMTTSTLTHTVAVAQTMTVMPSSTPSQILTHTPSLASSPTSSRTPVPVLEASALEDITVFFVHNTYTESAKLGKVEMSSEIWKIQADGSEKQKLLWSDVLEQNWLAYFGDLRLSHNGQQLVFIQNISLWRTTVWSSSLWTMSTDGSSVREWVGQIPGKAKPGSAIWTDRDEVAFNTKPKPMLPVWSQDDSMIAFVNEYDPQFGQVCVLDLTNGQWRRIDAGDVVDWSPDGRALIVRSNAFFADTQALRIVDLDGQIQANVELSSDVILMKLDWSESAKLIVALGLRRDDPVYDIYLIDPYSELVQTIGQDVSEFAPQWAPNGQMIAFAYRNQDERDLYVVNLDGKAPRLIMPQVGYSSVWSPDSRFILAQSGVEGDGLYIVSVSDGRYWKIPNTEGASSQTWLFPLSQ